jgi:hypothetical protein
VLHERQRICLPDGTGLETLLPGGVLGYGEELEALFTARGLDDRRDELFQEIVTLEQLGPEVVDEVDEKAL